jgi:putative restriction endonuclease
MRLFVGVTDYDWFQLHASKPQIDEVNFWRPSPDTSFRALSPGELLLFKLHSPRNLIAGGGFFTRFLHLPISLAWDAFGEGNGVRSLVEMRALIGKYRKAPIAGNQNPPLGCIMLAEPFFLPKNEWIPVPPDFSLNIVQGKGYDTGSGAGQALWAAVSERLAQRAAVSLNPGPATIAAAESARYGQPTLVRPRLGQGLFRVLVTEAYDRRCAMTNERTLPVLQAAHIKPYALEGPHELNNGLLLRSDLHTLFDQGYVTVDPANMRMVVSPRIREEFENGRHYYALHGQPVRLPSDSTALPAVEHLAYHAENVFR